MRYKSFNKAITTILAGSLFLSYPIGTLNAYADPVSVDISHQGFADLVAKVKPSVVSVQVRSDKIQDDSDLFEFFDLPDLNGLPDDSPITRFFKDFHRNFSRMRKFKKNGHLRLVAQGSGFFISKDGYVVTNDHVVNDGTAFSVVLDDGKEYKAKLIGRDQRTDLALLKVDAKDVTFPYVEFGDDSKVRVGDWILAVGNPFGLGGTVTAGIVSARGRDIGASAYDDFIQIDAAVNRGNSGGPAFTIDGKVVGINTAIYSPSGGSIGIAFAIPSSTAQSVVKQLIAKGKVERAWLGVQIQSLTKEIADSMGLADNKGALVVQVTKDSPAAKVGIKIGDIITAIDGAKVKDARDLAKKIAVAPSHGKVTVSALSDNKPKTFSVVLDIMPKDTQDDTKDNDSNPSENVVDILGIDVSKNTKGAGLVITDVDIDSEASDIGLRPGLVIVRANSQKLNSVEDLKKAIDDAKKAHRKSILLQVVLGNQNRFVALPIK